MQKSTLSSQSGFTLIELLVVIAIIGILAAIAIPQFAAYRQRSFNATAISDLRNALVSQEEYYVENNSYVSCASAAACEAALTQFRPSRDGGGAPVLSTFEFVSAGQSFTASARHQYGTIRYDYDSATGVIAEN